MRKGRMFRIVAVGFVLLSLVTMSTYAAGNTPATVQDQPVPGDPPPEIRVGGYSYGYFESPITTGRTDESRDMLSPSAIEGQPRQLDWTPVRRVAVRPYYPQTLYATIDNLHGLWRSTNGGGYWEQMPFGIGSGRAIVFANSSTAVATFGYYDYGIPAWVNGGIWRTDDGGNTWQNLSAGIDTLVVAVAFAPGNPNRMYVSTFGAGIYRGDYSGGTVAWVQKNSGLGADTWIYSIAVSPDYPNILYAGGYEEVYRSDDYGDNWIIADNDYPSDYIAGLAVAPGNGDTWYAGARRMDTSDPEMTIGGFWKSTSGANDGGLVLKNSGMRDTFVLDIVQDPVNTNILYAGTWASGFFRSDDGGNSWQEKNAYLGLPYIYGIEARDDSGNTVLYLANFYDGAGLYKSIDRGDTWTDVSSYGMPEKFDVTTTTDANHLAIATGIGVFFSENGGANWYISNGLTDQRDGIVLELARDPNNGSKLLAATYGGGIWTSTDAGWNWTETSSGIGSSSYVFDLSFRPGSSTTAYAGSWGVYRTLDGGATWAPLGTLPQYVRDVDALGASSAYDLFAGTAEAGVYKSPSANGTWTAINTGLGEYRIRSLKALTSNQVFAGTNGASAWKYDGASWTKKGPTILAPGVIQIAIDPYTPSIIYAATDQGVYRSTNSGESWTPKNVGLGGYGDLVISGISIDPSNTATIYLATWGYGIYKSTDSGGHWTRLADPLKCSKVFLPVVLKNHKVESGFDSQFNGSAAGWVAHVGTWYVSDTVLWTPGVAGTTSSVSYDQTFSNFVYEARVGRLGCDTCANRLYIRGTPYPLTSGNDWYYNYKFQYNRQGQFSVYKTLAGGTAVALQYWTSSSAIIQGSYFNRLRVVASGPNLYFYINGTLVWSGTDTSLSSGRVGLGMYRSADSTGDEFQADWATLTVLSGDTWPHDVVSAEQQALNDAANLRGGGSVDEAPSDPGWTGEPVQDPSLVPLRPQTERLGLLDMSD